MKKWTLILLTCLLAGLSSFAQNDELNEGKLQERMRLYVQNRLSLSKAEAKRFTPVFIRYFRDVKEAHREHVHDKLKFQQKVIDLRLRYRSEFRQIMDEQRANKVYKYEDDFRREVIQIIRENQADRIKTRRNNKSVIPY